MTENTPPIQTPKARRQSRLKRRLTSASALNAIAIFVICGGIGSAMAIHIQQKYHLYSSSSTMTLIGCVTAAIMLVVIALLDRRWYVAAWAAGLILPPIAFVFALRILAANPPVPPLG